MPMVGGAANRLGTRGWIRTLPRLMHLLEELDQRILLADGGMLAPLRAAGLGLEDCPEEWCVSAPEKVERVHAEYLAAGARMIRTNSYGANALHLARHGFGRRVSELNWSAAQLARAAAKESGAWVAGCVGPLEAGTLTAAEVRQVFEDQIGALLDGGAQCILLDGFHSIEHALIAIEVKHSLHHCPVICALASEAADGPEKWSLLQRADADVIGVSGAKDAAALPAGLEIPLAVFLPSEAFAPEEIAGQVRTLTESAARIVGGARETTPAHLAALASVLFPD